jgi:electron transfer flavoprotein beta subunit
LIKVKRELEGGWFQWVAMPLPAVLTIQSGINPLRYATLRGIMAAKRKAIAVLPAPAAAPARERIVVLTPPARAQSAELMTGTPPEAADQLVRRLRDTHVL